MTCFLTLSRCDPVQSTNEWVRCVNRQTGNETGTTLTRPSSMGHACAIGYNAASSDCRTGRQPTVCSECRNAVTTVVGRYEVTSTIYMTGVKLRTARTRNEDHTPLTRNVCPACRSHTRAWERMVRCIHRVGQLVGVLDTWLPDRS